MANRPKMIIFITKTQLIFYGSNIKNVAILPLKPEVMNDLEIVNKEALEAEITTFIKTNKIESSSVIIMISTSLIFSKTFPAISAQYTEDQLKTDTDTFLSYVPFQNPLDKVIKNPKDSTIIVTNGDIYTVFKQIFEKMNFTVDAIAPLFIIFPNVGDNFTAKVGEGIIGKIDWVQQNAFQIVTQPSTPEEAYAMDEAKTTKEKDNKNTYVLVGVFVLLMVVLGVMLFLQNKENSKPPAVTPTPTVVVGTVKTVPTAVPTLIPTATAASSSATVNEASLPVEILNGSGKPGEAEKLKNALTTLGFNSIQTGNAPTVTLARTIVVFTQKVPTTTREKIMTEVRKFYPDNAVQESKSADFDVVITIASPSQ